MRARNPEEKLERALKYYELFRHSFREREMAPKPFGHAKHGECPIAESCVRRARAHFFARSFVDPTSAAPLREP